MANYNKLILAGHLTRDPQLSYTPSNMAVCECGIAVNHKWKSADGQVKEEVCFLDLQLFGRQAETFNQYMAKGRAVLIEGRLRFETWEGKDGGKRSKHRMVVERCQFLGDGQPRQQAPRQDAPPPRPSDPAADGPIGDDDIPF